MTDNTNISGGCLCGAVRYTLSGPVHFSALCHCPSCRKSAGAPIVSWAMVDADAVQTQGDSLRVFESSPGVRRSFCGDCGTALFYESDAMGPLVDVTIESLDDPDAVQPDTHIWHKHARPYLAELGGMTVFEALPPQGE